MSKKKLSHSEQVKKRLENYIIKLHTAIANVIAIENDMEFVIIPYLEKHNLLEDSAIKAMVENINSKREVIAKLVSSTRPFKEVFGDIEITKIKLKDSNNGT